MITNKKILITGATGQVASPIVESLLKNNEVWCAARFSDPALKKQLEDSGAKTFTWELGSNNFNGLPTDFNYVLHSAWGIYEIRNDFDKAISANVEGTGLLMSHCRNAEAMLFISSLVVYRERGNGDAVYKETGEAYGNDTHYAPTYGVSKVAGEAVIRTLSRIFSLPVTIARLGMAYGVHGHGGRPVHVMDRLLLGKPIYITSRRNIVSMIHEEDLMRDVEPLLKAAAVPPTIVNWVSDEVVDELEMLKYVGKVAGIEPKFVVKDEWSNPALAADSTVRRSITGPSLYNWKAGILKTLRARYPNHTFTDSP